MALWPMPALVTVMPWRSNAVLNNVAAYDAGSPTVEIVCVPAESAAIEPETFITLVPICLVTDIELADPGAPVLVLLSNVT